MTVKPTPFEIELGQRVDEALYYVWDPIGVSDTPEARDEYSGYALRATGMLLESATAEAIADFLLNVESVRMGLNPHPEQARLVATLLLDWKSALQDKHDRPDAVWRTLPGAVRGES